MVSESPLVNDSVGATGSGHNSPHAQPSANDSLTNPVDIGGAFSNFIGAIVGDSNDVDNQNTDNSSAQDVEEGGGAGQGGEILCVEDPNLVNANNLVCQPATNSRVDPEDREKLGMGCTHYLRFCKLVSNCCGEVHACRHCHNDKYANHKNCHELERHKTEEIICSKCDTKQAPSRQCSNPECGIEFAEYFCSTCKFWDGEGSQKQVFHCDDCGICRVGGRENYFHCYTCGSCYPNDIRDGHKCVENAMKQNCPICQDDLFQSVKQVTILRCGHTIHQECLINLRSSTSGLQSLRCPMCMTSFETPEDLRHVWQQIDHELMQTPMPHEYSNVNVHIQCNDCHQSNTVPFHILALKCPGCNSYNTRREGVFAAEAVPEEQTNLLDAFEAMAPLLEAGGGGDVPGQNAVDPFADDGEDDESDSGSNDEDEFYGLLDRSADMVSVSPSRSPVRMLD